MTRDNLDCAQGGMEDAKRNTLEGVWSTQAAKRATSEVGNLIKRRPELAVKSNSEALATTACAYIKDPLTNLSATAGHLKPAPCWTSDSRTIFAL
ncbi:MAG: hypothetical protein GWP91_24340 [Rhodobacterales bacterium]|nr:hypothetical protein [Rhodobacterales bacterium]